jgi:hypothetical protein
MHYQPMTIQERNALPRLRIHKTQFDALPEYSLTRPTGVYEGKLWRSVTSCGRWIVNGYLAHPTDPTKCIIQTWKPFFSATVDKFVIDCHKTYRAQVDRRG